MATMEMEAALLKLSLNPAAALVDCNSLNAELEVRKLQELVRKLERQNEQLRMHGASGCPGSPHHLYQNHHQKPSPLHCQTSSIDSEELLDYFHPYTAGDGASAAGEEEEDDGYEPSVLDELELLDLDSLSCSDESDETWLYVSSKSREPKADPVSPLQWCRQVLDAPKSEVEAARRSLSLRLEQVSRWRSSLSSPSPSSSPGPPLSRLTGLSPIGASSPLSKPCSTPQSSDRHGASSIKAASHKNLASTRVNPLSLSSPLHYRTPSPVGKDLSPLAERTPTFFPHRRSRSLRRSGLSPQSSVDSEAEDDSIALGYKLQDLTDVQVMARLQEESLRQDYASTSTWSGTLANRRSQSFSFQLSRHSSASGSRGLEEEDEEEDEDYGLLPPPQPRLTHTPITRLSHSHTFCSARDWPRGTHSSSSSSSLLLGTSTTPPSTPSTPHYPSAGFAYQAQSQALGLGSFCEAADQQCFRPGSDKLRRSMPNLVRAPSMPSVPIPTNPSAFPSLLRNSLSFDSSSGLARLQSSIPSPGQLQNRVQSVGNFASLSRQPLKATAYVSPTIKGSSSASLQCLNSSSSSSSGIPLLSKMSPTSTLLSTPRSGLPRPASFVCTTSSTPRSKVAQPARSLLTPPKSLSTLSALRDSNWRDGCY